jgi:DNA (cytosine-5)-methyltransferase 1
VSPRILDAFCKAGGAGMGYHRAGFDVIGVDIEPQPHYPFRFVQADVFSLPARWIGNEFDAVHASPPCQAYSKLNRFHKREYPLLLEPTRALLQASGLPFIIENVPGAPLIDPVTLCGVAFGLQVIRHRAFESNWALSAPVHVTHPSGLYSPTGHGDPNWAHREANPHLSGIGYTARCRVAMGIMWMTRNELAEAIPPAYTEHLGRQLVQAGLVNDRRARWMGEAA